MKDIIYLESGLLKLKRRHLCILLELKTRGFCSNPEAPEICQDDWSALMSFLPLRAVDFLLCFHLHFAIELYHCILNLFEMLIR